MELVIRRSIVVAAASIVLGVVAALAACELFVRVVMPPFPADRILVLDYENRRSADCYPRAPGVSFPLDLERENDRQQFVWWLAKVIDADAVSAKRLSEIDGLEGGLDSRTAASKLAKVLPLCVTYDHHLESSRFFVRSPGAKQTIALLGDSFVFGQGVVAEATFSAGLARELETDVRSYALAGANMPEIERQFEAALHDASKFGVSRIAYVYVLNDPYPSPELSARLIHLNDLMNVRLVRAAPWLAALNSVSALSRRLTQAVARKTIAAETLRWYSDLHDPKVNPGIEQTMERLAAMTRESRKRGIDFVVLVYPLMLDMANYPLADVHRHLHELAGRYGVELHDLLPAFEARGRGATLVVHPLDYHPNAFAQRIAAEEAAAYLRGRTVRK